MTKTTKKSVIITALLVIAMCISLLAGATFAIFTAESKANIAVTSGKVDVLATVDAESLVLYSPTIVGVDDTNAATATNFKNGGTATLTDNGITLKGITPADKATFNITLQNKSDINIKWRLVVDFTGDKMLLDALEVRWMGDVIPTIKTATKWMEQDISYTNIIVPFEISIELPADVTNNFGGKTCAISFLMEAVQGNAPTMNYIKDGVVGTGTASDPYLIGELGGLKLLNEFYREEYNVKVADGVTEIDCADLGDYPIHLTGNFDGNGVTFKNIKSRLFGYVGDSTKGKSYTLKNFTAEMAGAPNSVVFTIDTENITFENVKVSGYMEGSWNMGAFVNYGTANGYSNGYDYTVNFVNCSCDAAIVSKQNSSAAVLVGHAYEGSGNTATINVDAATNEGVNGARLIAKGPSPKGYKYFGLKSSVVKVYVDGVLQEAAGFNDYPCEVINEINPTKGETAYQIATMATAKTLRIQIVSQLTAYDAEGNKIPRLVGITFTNYTETKTGFEGGSTVDVYDLFDSVVIKNEYTASGKPELKLIDGVLYLYTNSSSNYLDGTVSLIVAQYEETGALIGSGVLKIYTIKKVNATETASFEAALANASAEQGVTTLIHLNNGTFNFSADNNLRDKSVVITGTKNSIIDMTNVATGQNTGNATIVFDGVTVKNGNENYKGIQHAKKVVFKNCDFIGLQHLYAEEVEFENVNFTNMQGNCIWTYGAKKVTFTNCKFTTGGKAVLIYNEATNFVGDYYFNNCEFYSDQSLTTERAAIETGDNGAAAGNNTFNIYINNCKQSGFSAHGSDNPLWGNKNSMKKNYLNVWIDEVKVY